MTRSVLIVDDNAPLAENLAELLSDHGYDTEFVVTPEEALAAAKRTHFDIVLLDVRLPRMDGVELHSLLARILPDSTYVLMTAFSADDRLEKARRAGVREILPKPVPVDRLLSAFESAARAGARVLVVDDDDALCSSLCESLVLAGFVCEQAGTLAQARARLDAGGIDVLILDLRLPDGDAIDLAREMRGKQMPVVLISGYDLIDVQDQLDQPAPDRVTFLAKPFAAESLLAAIARLGGAAS